MSFRLTNMTMELEPLGWSDMSHLSIKKLWEWFTNYCYMERLFDRSVLEATIKAGVNRIPPDFGFAEGVDVDGNYRGLKLSEAVTPYFDDMAVIVQPEIARAQREAELAEQRRAVELITDPQPDKGGDDDPAPDPAPVPCPRQKPKRASTARNASTCPMPSGISTRSPTKSCGSWPPCPAPFRISQLISLATAQRVLTTPPCAHSAKTAACLDWTSSALKTNS